ncbi:hypothetical protein HKX48_001682 [Thoreauomyces humboldtii]|nr:hypothetical protein HKX48_001682 [Thoreauomyces humboldtii]
MDSGAACRLRFLHEAAHTLHASHPGLSRRLVSSLSDTCAAASTSLPESLVRRFCSRCGSLFVPGQNASVSIRSTKPSPVPLPPPKSAKKSSKKSKKLNQTQTAGIEKRVVINRIGRTLQEARKQKDGLLTYVVYVCAACGAETRLPGKPGEPHDAKRVTRRANPSVSTAKRVVTPSLAHPPPQSAQPQTIALAPPITRKPGISVKESKASVDPSPPPAPPMLPAATEKKKKKNARKTELRNLLAGKKDKDQEGAGGGYSLTDFLSEL